MAALSVNRKVIRQQKREMGLEEVCDGVIFSWRNQQHWGSLCLLAVRPFPVPTRMERCSRRADRHGQMEPCPSALPSTRVTYLSRPPC